jgi:hypothetical protein
MPLNNNKNIPLNDAGSTKLLASVKIASKLYSQAGIVNASFWVEDI